MTPTPPRKSTPRKPPVPRPDNIKDWADNQPAVTVVREPGDDDYFPDTPPDVQEDERVTERAPTIPSPIASRARSLADRARAALKPAPKKAAKPKVAKPRVSVDQAISSLWSMGAKLIAPVDPHVARVLAMQAPVAGLILEDKVRNTAIDRMLQPLARVTDGGEMALAMVGPPIIVGVLSRKPETAPILVPLLRQALRSWIDLAGPKIQVIAQQEAEFEQKYGQTIDAMIAYILGETDVPGSVPVPGNGPVPGPVPTTPNGGGIATPSGLFRAATD